MQVVLTETVQEMSLIAADIFEKTIRARPESVLGLATGSTPEKLYAELVRRHCEEGLDFSRVKSFNLDEYVGLNGDHDQSYRYFMNQRLFKHINIQPWNARMLDGMARDPWRECLAFELAIEAAGGVDLCLLGIGTNGHVAFNEPGSLRYSRTRIVKLVGATITANSRFFTQPNEVPAYALTVGLGTILEARHIVLLANGEHKANAIKAAVEGPVSEDCPASFLQIHPEVLIIVDKPAASKLSDQKLRGLAQQHVERSHDWLSKKLSLPRIS
jgi:glucosamine-6-phosphate deaminase